MWWKDKLVLEEYISLQVSYRLRSEEKVQQDDYSPEVGCFGLGFPGYVFFPKRDQCYCISEYQRIFSFSSIPVAYFHIQQEWLSHKK